MAILVNWFEVTFDRKELSLPFLSRPPGRIPRRSLDTTPPRKLFGFASPTNYSSVLCRRHALVVIHRRNDTH